MDKELPHIAVVIEDGILLAVLVMVGVTLRARDTSGGPAIDAEVIYLDPKGDDPTREKKEQARYEELINSGHYINVY